MIRGELKAAVLAAVVSVATTISARAQDRFFIRATIVPADGQSLELAPASLSVRIDGAPVEVRSVLRMSSPLSIALLLDGSNSTLWNSLEASLVTASTRRDRILSRVVEEGFLKRLPADARLRVFGFNDPAAESAAYEVDRSAARRAINAALALPENIRGGSSPVWDVAMTAVRSLASQPHPRALVVFTDGEVTGSSQSMADVASVALPAQVSIHVISAAVDLILPQLGGMLESRPSEQLRQLSRITGGAFLQAPGAEEIYRPYLQYESLSSYSDIGRRRRPTWDPDPQ